MILHKKLLIFGQRKFFKLKFLGVYHMVVDETHNPCESRFNSSKMTIKLTFHKTLDIILFFVIFKIFRLKEFPSITENNSICFQLPCTVSLQPHTVSKHRGKTFGKHTSNPTRSMCFRAFSVDATQISY